MPESAAPRHSNNDIELLYSAAEVGQQVQRLAENIASDFDGGDNLLIVALLKGSFVFAADLVRALHSAGCHPQIDFMTLSSYGNRTESAGTVTLIQDIRQDITDKNVLIVDDILESGRTLAYAQELLKSKGAASIKSCVLLDKPKKRAEGIATEPEYIGFEIEDKFVIGYGLDFANYYRELPYIGVLKS